MIKFVVCEKFKFKDFMLKGYLNSEILPNHVYPLVYCNGCPHLLIEKRDSIHYFPIGNLSEEYDDGRYKCIFHLLNERYIVEYGLPEIPNGIIDNWLSKEIDDNGNVIEDIDDPDVLGFDEDEISTLDQEFGIVVDSFSRIQESLPQLSSGILEAITGVETFAPGELMDEDRSKLIEALKGVIDNFDKTSDTQDLIMAQYLLFNIINFAKNKW